MSNDLHDKSTDIVYKKRNDNSILEQLEEKKNKKKMTTMLSSSAEMTKHERRFVKLRRFKVSIF